jgi:hypothetical protein
MLFDLLASDWAFQLTPNSKFLFNFDQKPFFNSMMITCWCVADTERKLQKDWDYNFTEEVPF